MLFLSVAYNIYWVAFERSSNSYTIHTLNTYIDKSKDLLIAINELNKKVGEYADLASESLITCGDGDLITAEKNAKRLGELLNEIETEKATVSRTLNDRSEFARQSGLKITYEN